MKKCSLLPVAVAGFLLISGTRAGAEYWYRPGFHPGPAYSTPVIVTPVRSYPAYDYTLASEVQVALKRRGYYRGPVDGIIGPSSRASIRAWQYDRRLRVTGEIDRPLLHSLGL